MLTLPHILPLEGVLEGPARLRAVDDWEVEVCGLFKSGLVVRCRGALAQEMRRRGALGEVRFTGPPLPETRLRVSPTRVELDSVEGCDGTALVALEATDDASKAAVWLLYEAARHLAAGGRPGRAPRPRERPPRIPARGVYTEAARRERVDYLRCVTGAALETLESTDLEPEKLTGNIENLIGGVTVPLGIVGPLWFEGQHVQRAVYAPFATTEGALVASATRGARAITESGGVRTRVLGQRMLRVPLWMLTDMQGALMFARWIEDHQAEIKEVAEQTSRHAQLVSVVPRVMGRMVHVPFVYETGDAAGQNMTTSATWHACQWIMAQMRHYEPIRFENFIVEANMSGDKKVTYNSFLSGRGTRVMAEAFLEEEVLRRVLKVTSEQLLRSFSGFVAGSIGAGMVGLNVNVSNAVAALFTATGQDIACVHESSLAQLHLEPDPRGVHASLMMPSLIVGTVGGGTHLPGQRDMLDLMGCAGPEKAQRFAEIVAGFALGLDLSTLSAITSGHFATAHERLGRNRPVDWFRLDDLDAPFFAARLREQWKEEELDVERVRRLEAAQKGSSIITELTARKVSKLVGHYHFELDLRRADGRREKRFAVAKVKPRDDEVIIMINAMASGCGGRLAAEHARFKARTGFAHCHKRELGVYRQDDPAFRRNTPAILGLYEDDRREAYVVIMERLEGLEIMDSADDVSCWTKEHMERALEGLAELHSLWLGREEEVLRQSWIGPVMTTADMVEMTPLWESLQIHAVEEFPELFSREDVEYHIDSLRRLDEWWPEIEAMPRTLVHNDFNPRNVAMRRTAEGELRLCAYDWELATLHIPQHDLAEFLAFTLSAETPEEEVYHWVHHHRRALERFSGRALDPRLWERGYYLALQDLMINRFALYIMAHTFKRYGFIERVVCTTRNLIRHAREGL